MGVPAYCREPHWRFPFVPAQRRGKTRCQISKTARRGAERNKARHTTTHDSSLERRFVAADPSASQFPSPRYPQPA